MYWLMVAKGMAYGMIAGGLLGALGLSLAGHPGYSYMLVPVVAAGLTLVAIEREIRR
jgi:hypothetical protein